MCTVSYPVVLSFYRLGTEKPQRAKGLIMFCLADKADMNISAIIHKTDHRRQKPLKRQPRIEDIFGDGKTTPFCILGWERERHTVQTNFNWSQFRPVSGSSTLLAWRRLCSHSSGQQCWPPHQIHHEIKWKVHSFETASSVISLLFGLCEQEINFLIMHPFQRRETTPGFYLWRQLGEHLVFWFQF